MPSEHLSEHAARVEAQALMVRNPLLRRLLVGLGAISLALGVVGIVMPVLPTTPFLLLTAALWSRSSERFYVWLLTHRFFGPPITRYRRDRCIPAGTKALAITMLAVSMTITIVWFIPVPAVKVLLACIGVGSATWILRIPTCRAPITGAAADPGPTPTG